MTTSSPRRSPKCFFQLVHRETGKRTEAVSSDRDSLANKLHDMFPGGSDDYVLVLVEFFDGEEWRFSQAPMMTVSHFVDAFSTPIIPFEA